MNDREIVEEILLIGDYTGDIDDILSRQGTVLDEDDSKLIELDLSNLSLDELSPTIDKLDRLQVLNLENNNLVYLPSEVTELNQLREIRIGGNPINSIPKFHEGVKIDLDLPTYDVSPSEESSAVGSTRKANQLKNRTKSGILFPDKICTWCDKAVGYRKEVQRSDSKWGFTTHVSTILVCLNCTYMHQFYSGRSIFDFE